MPRQSFDQLDASEAKFHTKQLQSSLHHLVKSLLRDHQYPSKSTQSIFTYRHLKLSIFLANMQLKLESKEKRLLGCLYRIVRAELLKGGHQFMHK